MAMIQSDDLSKIKTFFDSHLQDPVTIELYTQPRSNLIVPGQQECEYCEETEQLLREVADVSDKVSLNVYNVRENPQAGAAHGIAAADVPAFVLIGQNKGQVRYFGIPAGYEFAGFLNEIAEVSTGETKLSQESLDQLANLASDVHIRVFVTPTWPYCPSAASLAHQMAIASPKVTADVIEAQEYPDLSNRFQVTGVPKIVINDQQELVGAQREKKFVEEVVKAGGS